MRVYELIEHLKECNPNSEVYVGRPLDPDSEMINNMTEVSHSTEVIPTVYLYRG